jgi:alpha-beta hydrolase superfamily lysophospholipase
MTHSEGNLNSSDGSRLYYQSWRPEHDSRAILAIVHGAGEHSGRYANVCNYFLAKHYSLYGFDFRGHGKSAGRVGHVVSWQQYREDLDCYLQLIREQNPDSSIFLYCHSMGAQIALDYLTMGQGGGWQLQGVVASSPALAQPVVNPLLLQVGRMLAALWPTFPLQNGLDVNAISRDPEVVRAYTDDPMVSSKISARFGAEFMACIDRLQSTAGNIDVPLLMFHGSADQIIPVAGTQHFFEQLNCADKTLKIYQDGFHEPHNDLQKQEVFQDIAQWLDAHLQD